MTTVSMQRPEDNEHTTMNLLEEIACNFVNARRHGESLRNYPGELPKNLDDGYQIQDIAIDKWHQNILGWKVGQIPVELRSRYESDRLCGPIFDVRLLASMDKAAGIQVFADGFAAVEAEFVAFVSEDAPPDKTSWGLNEAADIIDHVHIGLEVASSPLANINDVGPIAVVSDFGNNYGLIVGARIANWRSRDTDSLKSETFVGGESVGKGGAFNLDGGIVRSVQFVLENAARRGRPLKAGDAIATGQTTGIHEVVVGDSVEIDFGRNGTIECQVVGRR